MFNVAYEEIIHWRRNLFLVPSGRAGKNFINECIQLIQERTNCSPLYNISLKALNGDAITTATKTKQTNEK